jgi:hypothetical protein
LGHNASANTQDPSTAGALPHAAPDPGTLWAAQLKTCLQGYAEPRQITTDYGDTLNFMADEVIEFIGVYDADATLIGEISYWLKARVGAAHCALCDLTHGVFRTKREWLSCSSELGIPFKTFHRNDAPADVLQVAQQFPVVLIRNSSGLSILLDAKALDDFGGDTEKFVKHLATTANTAHGS